MGRVRAINSKTLMRFSLLCTLAASTLIAPAFAKTDYSTFPFKHPGVLVSQTQLDTIKQRVRDGVEPQKSAFAAALASPYADLAYAPSPRATIECGPYSKPDLGCKDERR